MVRSRGLVRSRGAAAAAAALSRGWLAPPRGSVESSWWQGGGCAGTARELRIGVVGAGNMGRGIARSLERAGHEVAQFDRDPAALDKALKAAGRRAKIRAAPSVAACCEGADAVVVSVSDEAAERAVFFGDGGVLAARPRLALNVGTTSVDWARELHTAAAASSSSQGGGSSLFLDAPVSGGPKGAEEGTLSVMCGGRCEAFEAARPVLDAMSAYSTLMGPPGSGAGAKLVNQLLTAANAQAAAEGLALARALGIDDLGALLALVEKSWGNSTMFQRSGDLLEEQADWADLRVAPSAAPLKNFVKDVGLVRAAARSVNVKTPSLDAVEATLRRADPHFLHCDWAAVATLTEASPRTYGDLVKQAPAWDAAAEPAEALRARILAQVQRQKKHPLAVVDDDPTGTQSVHGVPVVSRWLPPGCLNPLFEKEEEKEEEDDDASCFYILANTRSLHVEKAGDRAEAIGRSLRVSTREPVRAVVSRSDSTLRGHFPSECAALARGLGWEKPLTLIAPAFFEGGRVTVDDGHYVVAKPISAADAATTVVRADETEFARDAAFGYSTSHLPSWVREKHRGVSGIHVESLGLGLIRAADGPDHVAAVLRAAPPGTTIIANALEDRDMLVVALGCVLFENDPAPRPPIVYRTAGSFVAARTAMEPRPLLTPADLRPVASPTRNHAATGGLVVVGSYVGKTTAQLADLRRRGLGGGGGGDDDDDGTSSSSSSSSSAAAAASLEFVELDVEEIVRDDEGCKAHCATRKLDVELALDRGSSVVLSTSRRVVTSADAQEALRIGARVNAAVVGLVRELGTAPSYVVAKGGITSNDVAVAALGVEKAMVLGQVDPGIPAWRLGPETSMPGSAYVVFPGNVGDEGALRRVVEKMHRATRPAGLATLLRAARAAGRAVGAFNIYTLEGLLAVDRATRQTDLPAIVQLHPASLQLGGTALLAACRDAATRNDLLHVALDHASDDGAIHAALPFVDHVMADGSHLPLEANTEWTRAIVDAAFAFETSVEAELGKLAGAEDGLAVDLRDAKMTDPDAVATFIAGTRVDALAVTVGNVHGAYASPDPNLDWPRLRAIRDAAQGVPLVLHGASGLSPDVLHAAIEHGVAKFNVNTELRAAARNATKQAADRGDDVLDTAKATIDAMARVVEAKIRAFAPREASY